MLQVQVGHFSRELWQGLFIVGVDGINQHQSVKGELCLHGLASLVQCLPPFWHQGQWTAWATKLG